MFKCMDKIFEKPENLFLFLCLFWGLIFTFISPPFTAADECSHFWKVYLVSEGHFSSKNLTSYKHLGIVRKKVVSTGGEYVPFGMFKAGYKNIKTRGRAFDKTNLSTTKEILSYPLEKNELVFNAFPVPAYSAMSYFPSFIFMKVMTLFNVNPGWMLYVLRLVSLFTYTALIYAVIKITPVKKWLFFSLALLPTAIYQASSVNTDGLTTGLGFLFVAYVFYLAYSENVQKITTKQLWTLGAVCLYFLLCKFAYLPMIFIYFLIPDEKFEDKKQKYFFFVKMALLTFSMTLILFLMNSKQIVGTDDFLPRQRAMAILFEHPTLVLKAILYTTLMEAKSFLSGFVGAFGWSETTIPFYSAVLYYFVIISFSLLNLKNEAVSAFITLKNKLGFFFIFMCYYFLLFLILFMIFQIRYDGMIDCFFGRYFIPIAPLLFLILYNQKLFLKTNFVLILNLVLINYVLFVSFIRILSRFYV